LKRLFFLTLLAVLASTAAAGNWHIETVDSGGEAGRYTSLALDSSDRPHIAYYDDTHVNLNYTWWNGTSWVFDTVDSRGQVGYYTSLALDAFNNPHISYHDHTNDDLKYAADYGPGWLIESLYIFGWSGFYTSLALDDTGDPHISFYYYTNGDLKYAVRHSLAWEFETVDTEGDVGSYTSLALDSSGNPHISYYDATADDLKYAVYNGVQWVIETVDTEGDVGSYTSLALDSSDQPHIAYYDSTNLALKYAVGCDSKWEIQTLEADGSGRYASLALDASGNPRISYYAGHPDFNLRYAVWNGSSWDFETVDDADRVGSHTSLALDSSGNPYIAYYDSANNNLKLATTAPGWTVDGIELTSKTTDSGNLVAWAIDGDSPASVRVLRGEADPVAVSDSLNSETTFWLDRNVTPGESYAYWLEVTEHDGSVRRCGPTEAVVVPEEAQRLTLDEPWPNPASESVSVAFELPEAQSVSLAVYDLAGRRVATLSEGELAAGRHGVSWSCAGAATGVYLLCLETAGESLSRRVVLGR
jgi:hypothetical protein